MSGIVQKSPPVKAGLLSKMKHEKYLEQLKCQISNFLYDITNDEHYSDEVILSDEDISKLTDRIVFRNTELKEILNNQNNKF
jgi:hypothetical protein|tara:strand:+ start:42 stop:287 length:246 start_codon:yes stop_codon:yes gene_type:complete